MTEKKKRVWIEDLEIADAQIKWSWSNFTGAKDNFGEEGKRYFVLILPREKALELQEIGWPIKENDPYEEGDEPEFTMKVMISYRFDPPTVFFVKNNRKIRVEEEKDISDIRRDSCEKVDVIISPNPWAKNGRSGITGYVKEMYVSIRQSRFAAEYEDFEPA